MVDLNSLFAGAAGGATVAVVIRAVDQYSGEFKKAGTSMQRFENEAKATSKGFGISSAAIIGAAAGMTLAVQKFAKEGVAQAVEFERDANRIRSLYGDLADTVIQSSQAMSRGTVFAQHEILESFSVMQLRLKDVGITFEQQQNLIRAAMDLSVTAGKSLSETIEDLSRALLTGTTRSLIPYGIRLKDVTDKQDILNAITNKWNDTLGASERFAKSYEGQLRILTNSKQQLAQTFGQFLLPELARLNERSLLYINVLDALTNKTGRLIGLNLDLAKAYKAQLSLLNPLFALVQGGIRILENYLQKWLDKNKVVEDNIDIMQEVKTTETTLQESLQQHTQVLAGTNTEIANHVQLLKAENQMIGQNEQKLKDRIESLERYNETLRERTRGLSAKQQRQIFGAQDVAIRPGVSSVQGGFGIVGGKLVSVGISMPGAQQISVKDFILSKGKLIKTDPQDTIIGVKNPDRALGGNVNIYITAHDSQEVANKVSRILADDYFARVSG